MYSLRDYQVEPVDVGTAYFQGPSTLPSIIVAPTAFGKSLLVAYIARNLREGVLVLQPSKELLEQNHGKFTAMGGEASIFSASFGEKEYGAVTYATLGSIKHLGAEFRRQGYRYVIIDEVHLYPRESDTMIGTFLRELGVQKVLGLTATPFKLQNNTNERGEAFSKLQMLTSKSKKGQLFRQILHVTQISEMTQRGYWAKLLYEQHGFDTSQLDFNGVRSEFTPESMLDAYHRSDVHGKVLMRLRNLDRKSILVFVPSVQEALDLAAACEGSAAVYGSLPQKERDRIIREFREGKIRIIFNVNVLAVGFDHPALDCIISARPTASLAWWYQAAGRGTRPCEGKEDCLVIDYVGNVERFGRLEDLYFKYQKLTWRLYGTGGRQLTGVPLHEIGEHFDPDLGIVPKSKVVPFRQKGSGGAPTPGRLRIRGKKFWKKGK